MVRASKRVIVCIQQLRKYSLVVGRNLGRFHEVFKISGW